jgi:hypothetical protein
MWQASSVDAEDVELCLTNLGECNLCDRIQSVANTTQETLNAAATVAVSAGAIVPAVLLLPGDPSLFGFWQRVFLIGGPTLAQLSGAMVVLLSGGWDLVMLHLTSHPCPLYKVSPQLGTVAKCAYALGFVPVVLGFGLMVTIEGLWSLLSIVCKFSPPSSDDFDDKDVGEEVMARLKNRANYLRSLMGIVQGVTMGGRGARQLHLLPAFDQPAQRHVDVVLCALFSR